MRIFNKNQEQSRIYMLETNESVEKIEYEAGTPAKIHIGNRQITAACIGCTNPRCINFSEQEVGCTRLPDFPYDKSTNVCPINAIMWNAERGKVEINNVTCFNCGLCASRCPMGAIYFDGTSFTVNGTLDNNYAELSPTDESVNKQSTQIESLSNAPKTGSLVNENGMILLGIKDKLESLRSQYHNTVTRNLLIGLGNASSMRRIGDVYTRMDAVYSADNDGFGAVEVEFGRDTLDASRGILDDIAVLNSRYGVRKNENAPLVVCVQLPNERQGYWQVVKDIMKVEGIKISTISICGMILLLWNFKSLNPADGDFYADYDKMEIRSAIETKLGRRVNLGFRSLGIFEPMK